MQSAERGVRAHGAGIQIDFVYKGKRYREKLKLQVTAANLKHAQNLRTSILNDIAFGRFELARYFPDRSRSVPATSVGAIGKALDDFLKYKAQDCALSTWRDYRSAVEFHLRPIFGHQSFDAVSPSQVRNWLASLSISNKRKNNILIPLREIFAHAFSDGLIAKSPLDHIENLRHTPDEPQPFSPVEVETLLDACDAFTRNLFQFAFATGVRTSELIALRWEDVDFAARTVHIRRARVRREIKTTKTTAGTRKIELMPQAFDALQKQRQGANSAFPEVFFNQRRNEPFVDDEFIRESLWYPAMKRAKLPRRNPYQTRHTFASWMLSAGVDPFWVSTQMGHKSLQMTLKRYAQWVPSLNRDAVTKANAAWSQFSHRSDASV